MDTSIKTYSSLLVGRGSLELADSGDVSVVLTTADAGSLSDSHCSFLMLQRERKKPFWAGQSSINQIPKKLFFKKIIVIGYIYRKSL